MKWPNHYTHFLISIWTNILFFIVNTNIHDPKLRFSVSSQNSISGKSIFGEFEVIFLNVKYFPGWKWLCPVSIFVQKFFNEKLSSLACLNKKLIKFSQTTNFGHFWLPRSTFKVDYLNEQAKFPKILNHFLGQGCWEHCVKFRALFLQKGVGGGSRFASRNFQ